MPIHEKCGGEIQNRQCKKCGKTWGKVRYIIAQDIGPEQPKTLSETQAEREKEYKQRIREGRDIWR